MPALLHPGEHGVMGQSQLLVGAQVSGHGARATAKQLEPRLAHVRGGRLDPDANTDGELVVSPFLRKQAQDRRFPRDAVLADEIEQTVDEGGGVRDLALVGSDGIEAEEEVSRIVGEVYCVEIRVYSK